MALRILAAAAIGLVLAGLAAPAAASTSECVLSAEAQRTAEALGAALNDQRRAAGLPPLRADAALLRAAAGHACDMAMNNFFGHRGSDGASTGQRAWRIGYPACTVSENLAWGYPEASTVLSGWLASPAHRQNILRASARDYGLAVVPGRQGPVWVLMIGGC